MAINYDVRMAAGKLKPEYQLVYKYGTNHDLGTTEEEIWRGTAVYTFPQTASTIEVISDSLEDTATTGDGARAIKVEGLDINGNTISDTIATNGTSASTSTTNEYLRVSRAYVPEDACGLYHGSNDGTITIRNTGAGTTRAVVYHDGTIGFGQTQQAIYTVPAGHRAILVDAHFDVDAGGASKKASVYFWRCNSVNTQSAPYSSRRVINQFDGLSGHEYTQFNGAITIPELTDLWVSAVGDQAGTLVTASFSLILEVD